MVGIGTDIQAISEFAALPHIRSPGIFFTDGELEHGSRSAAGCLASLAGILAAKESLLKAVPSHPPCCWLDIEIRHSMRGAPFLQFHGTLASWFVERNFRAHLSISHSGNYATAVVLIEKGHK